MFRHYTHCIDVEITVILFAIYEAVVRISNGEKTVEVTLLVTE